jgi:predicted nuclease of predicted toxin-antitoxin system
LKIRFQADAHVDPDIGRGLIRREPLIDWQPAQGLIADRTGDLEVLKLALAMGRTLVSRDVRTMPGYFAAFIRDQASPGVILIPPGTATGNAIERLLIAWLSWTAEDLDGQIRWLPG